MKKTTIKSLVLAAFMALPMLANAQTFSGIETEKANQNTPEGWTAVNLPQLPEITAANTFNIKDYGASTDAADNTKAIQKALDAVPATGGMVVIPAGTWLFGSTDQMTSTTEVLSINSKTVLHLCAGATLKLVEYGKAPNNKTLFIGCKNKNQSDIVIEGEGETSVLDGQGARWWLAREQGKTFNPGAFIRFERGQRFLLRNFKIQNTPGVNITISNSGKASHATIHDVIISEPASEAGAGKASHNTDGISIWGPYVNIYNCNISNGDDNVVCDNDAQYIHVWNCNFGTGHGASIGSYTHNIKHVWFDQITMNGTTAGVRLKTGSDTKNGITTLRGGGEEDFKFTNITMTKVKNPFSMDCYYDKNYNQDPAVDKENARALDSTTPTYNGILLQNIKTTDTSSNYAIFLVGRPESHIKNVTLDNVQIKAKRGIDIRFVDNIVFKNGSKISCTSGNLWVKNFDSTVDDQCNATGAGDTPTPPAEGDEVSYTLSTDTYKSSSTDKLTWTFDNGCSISNDNGKSYSTAKSNTIKYSKGTQYTINLPENVHITSASFAGYANEDNKTCYLAELGGSSFGSDLYVFPSRSTDTSTKTDVTLGTSATGTLTFTSGDAQAAWVITLKGIKASSTGIHGITTAPAGSKGNIYDLSGRVIKKQATTANLASLSKGIYILNNKKYVVK